MMGVGHALSGLLAGVATAPLVPSVADDPIATVAWVALWTGLSIGPDIDTRGSAVGRMWGPVTRGVHVKLFGKSRTVVPGLADVIGTVAGGHRNGTHSVLGILAVLVLVWVGTGFRVGTAIVVAFGTALVLTCTELLVRVLRTGWPINLGVSVLAGVLVWQSGTDLPGWVPFAMAGGYTVHILGDCLTVQGCPLGWPTSKARLSFLPIEAGGITERFIFYPAMITGLVLLVSHQAGFDMLGAVADGIEAAR